MNNNNRGVLLAGLALLSCALASSPPPSSSYGGVDCSLNLNSTAPQGVHLAYAGDPASTIALSFFSCALGGAPFAHLVPVGGGGGVGVTVFGATSKYYVRQHHDIVVTGLEPGTVYTYRVGLNGNSSADAAASPSTAAAALSPEYRFRTAPAVQRDTDGNAYVPMLAVVIGDMGVNESAGTIQRLNEKANATSGAVFNLTIHVGDISYADDVSITKNRGMCSSLPGRVLWADAIMMSRARVVSPGRRRSTTDRSVSLGLSRGRCVVISNLLQPHRVALSVGVVVKQPHGRVYATRTCIRCVVPKHTNLSVCVRSRCVCVYLCVTVNSLLLLRSHPLVR